MTARPVIGLCAVQAHAAWSAWNQEAVLLPRDYVRAVQRAGGLPLVLVPDPVSAEDPDELLDRIDALVLAGGVDVGEDPDRDAFELALARRAFERDLPVLAICRGLQVMNVAHGGTLIEHVPDVVGHEDHRHSPGTFSDHRVTLAEGSLAARAAGQTDHPVKSHHHQAVDRLADGFTLTGHAAGDGLPEAMEAPDRRFVLGVQWHPEVDEGSRLIAALVEEARGR